MSNNKTRTTVYLDNSIESELVAKELDKTGTTYKAIYIRAVTKKLPAIKNETQAIFGYENIRCYLLPTLPPIGTLHKQQLGAGTGLGKVGRA